MDEIRKYLKKNLTCLPIKSEKISFTTRLNEKRKITFDFVIRTIKNDIVAVGQFIPNIKFENDLEDLNNIERGDFPYPLFLFYEKGIERVDKSDVYSYGNIRVFKPIIEPLTYCNLDELARDLKRLSRNLMQQEDLLLELFYLEQSMEHRYKTIDSLELEKKELKKENMALIISNGEKSNNIYNNAEKIKYLNSVIENFEKEAEERTWIEFRNCIFSDDLVKSISKINYPKEGEHGYMGWVYTQDKHNFISYYQGDWYFQKCTFEFSVEIGATMPGFSYCYKYNNANQTFEKLELRSGLNIPTWIDLGEFAK